MEKNAAVHGREEGARLEALRRYEILDTPPDGAFDQITAVAAAFFRVPIAIVSLVDHDRIWFKSRMGLDAREVEREPGLCSSAILSSDLYRVHDAAIDPRTLANPLVTGELGLRFYAAAPLRTHDGFNLGTLCVSDREPRELTATEAEMLTRLASLVMDQMELRLAARKVAELERAQQELNEKLRDANRALGESEEAFRDLFEEAPFPYVYEGTDSRLIRVNRAGLTTLGIRPDEVATTYGQSLVADTPENKRVMREAFETVSRGEEAKDIVLELRRKDDGKPVWVQWRSKPAAGRGYTRTMLVDITARVLLEREQARLQAQNAYLYEEILTDYNFGAVIGESPALQKVMEQTRLVAATDASVLIHGESGTGKELIARAIHEQSTRKSRVLIKVNCSAIPDSLFESEFFGHVRGAFTGAIKDKPGRFELADGGTLFLDEIGEIPLAMQAKLLRVLQEQEVERVGDTTTRKVDVRIIAATNRDLRIEAEEGRFRQDLYYRLSVFPISLPPLRERLEDIPLLATSFARKSAKQMGRPTPQITRATMEALAAYDWPGNIRELQNAVERAVIVSRGGPLQFELPKPQPRPAPVAPIPASSPPPALLTREELKRQERDNVVRALKQADGKIFGPGGAAELLGMKPTTLASRIRALGLSGERSGEE
ncbi:MAG: sigma 54-interacting transcriptional regulator [Myxococcales bacterium]|nr:sigma 54-interacting transcriptional regulator [Myxococcales bacterium]